MRILSVVSLKTYERYGYTFLIEIVLYRSDYKEYKISKADFKNLHPNDFEDLYLLHLQDGNPSSVTMKMEILPVSTANSTAVDLILQAGNSVKEILLNFNLPDHRSILTDSK
ncbi:hypothetical protein Tco_0094073, partial [Tanacetum coccineum]